MLKNLVAMTAAALIAGAAFAQSELLQQAQNAVRDIGVDIEIPATATDEQLTQIIAMASTGGMDQSEAEGQIKQILGMQ